MAIEIDASLAPELMPLAWLVGTWEGVGVVGYPGTPEKQFGQRIEFHATPGVPVLHYTAQAWLMGEEGVLDDLLTLETGFWQVVRDRKEYDVGPGMLVPTEDTPFTTAESVEALRNDDGDFDIEVEVVHPHGVMELYAGRAAGPRIDLATDVVARTRTAKPYTASTRMYGLVDGDLLWAWDMAALGHERTSHASAQLKKVE
ncbi:FABP family protein [Brevibacterium litoralis]|uniref:FABP family protein n=1 Tax=Brevibacterium litoralis TaxID=3138935 RepID=UPI0032F06DAA